jgi:predicted ATP-dependent endonuclease of OLD family
MQSRLIVKNFGPIEFVDLDLRNVNVFIGPQASGKSALAKLYTIFKAPRKFLKNGGSDNKVSFLEALEEYNIASFLKPDTEIKFDSEEHALTYSKASIHYDPKLKHEIDDISNSFEKFKKSDIFDFEVKEKIKKLQERYKFVSPQWYEINIDATHEEKYDKFGKAISSFIELEDYLSNQAAVYIPSERSFINIVKNSSLNLLLNNVPIPKHILLFGAEIEKANVPEINLNFLHENLVYKNINGEARIFMSENDSIKLIEAAAGVQSTVNILIPILAQNKTSRQRSFVIEEPELNLFPTAQYELIQMLESLRQGSYSNDTGSIHTYTTHSPYILSAFNNLLYASKVWNKFGVSSKDHDDVIIDKLKSVILPKSNVPPNDFSAYQIKNGKAESVFDGKTGLIKDNYIDEASDKMADDFDALMDLMK